MNVVKRGLYSVLRKKVKSILLFIIVLSISCFIMAAMASKNAQITTQDKSRAAVGLSLRLELNENDRKERLLDLPIEKLPNGATISKSPNNEFESVLMHDILKISNVEGIESYNIITGIFAANPVNFERIEDPERDQYNDEGGVNLHGNLDMAQDINILNGNIKLIKGRWGTEADQNVCVVSEEIAEKNKFKIGDLLEFNNYHDKEGSTIYKAELIGIYSTSKEITPLMRGDTYRTENAVFTDLRFPEKPTGAEGDPLYQYAIFNIDGNKNYDRIKESVKKADVNWKRYDLIDNSGKSEVLADNLGQLGKISNVMFAICLISGFLILFLNFIFWIRLRKVEIGILMALGKSKLEILAQLIIEASFITIFSLLISLFISPGISQKLTTYIVAEQEEQQNKIDEINKAQTAGLEYDFSEEQVVGTTANITYKIIINVSLLVIIMAIGAVSLASVSIMKKKPKEILSEI